MTLQLIAAQMAAQLAQTGQPVRYALERGLHLVLWRDGLDTILSLTRAGAVPSVAEVKACQNAFAMPPNVAIEEDQLTWHTVRLRWPEKPGPEPCPATPGSVEGPRPATPGPVEAPAQEQLFDPEPVEGQQPNHYRGDL